MHRTPARAPRVGTLGLSRLAYTLFPSGAALSPASARALSWLGSEELGDGRFLLGHGVVAEVAGEAAEHAGKRPPEGLLHVLFHDPGLGLVAKHDRARGRHAADPLPELDR